jgi:outer membrane protein OmpA-like peptidoglycan-associated protein
MRWVLLISALVAISPAAPVLADPVYSEQEIVDFLLSAKLGGQRGLSLRPDTFDLVVTFDFDSDRLTPPAKVNLEEFAKGMQNEKVAKALSGDVVEIDGYTDATGTEMYNRRLSERRAQSVVDYLVQKGVSRSALTAIGFGAGRPRVADNPYDAANRRVEAHLVD